MGRITALVATLAVGAAAASADGVGDKVDAITKEVAKLRGLRVKKPVKKELVTADDVRARVAVMADKPEVKRTIAAEQIAYARWGLIAPSVDYAQLMIDLRGDQIVGFYEPETKKLTLVEGAITDERAAELVLAHEIQHALQDQAFDLAKVEAVPETEGDAKRARRALVEGDALATMVEVMLQRRGSPAPWSDPEITAALEKSMSIPGKDDSLDRAPLVVREAMMFPYQAGLSFVAALRRRQPWSAVDAAFARPPSSTEQVLHPERYQAREEPVPVEIVPPAELSTWTLGQSTVWGELGFVLWLRTHGVDSAQAAIAADGWGGDRVLTLVRPDDARPERAIGIARFEWDSEADAIEAAEAAERALDNAIAGATLERDHARTRWFSIDGTVAWIERKGPAFVMVIGAPAWMTLDVWSASSVKPPPLRK